MNLKTNLTTSLLALVATMSLAYAAPHYSFRVASPGVLAATPATPIEIAPEFAPWSVAPAVLGDSPFTLTAPSSTSPGLFRFTSSNPSVASVNGTTLSPIGVGTTTLTAIQDASGGFASGSTSTVFTVAAPARVYARLNTADTSDGGTSPASLGFSNGDLTVAKIAPTSHHGVRATLGKSSGKWYWEVKVDNLASNSNVSVGVEDKTSAVSAPVGNANGQSYSWGWRASTYKEAKTPSGNLNGFYGTALKTGDVVGIALDMDSKTISTYLNGTSQGVLFAGIVGTVYPAVALYELNHRVTANFGATPFQYAVPAGFNAGVYQ